MKRWSSTLWLVLRWLLTCLAANGGRSSGWVLQDILLLQGTLTNSYYQALIGITRVPANRGYTMITCWLSPSSWSYHCWWLVMDAQQQEAKNQHYIPIMAHWHSQSLRWYDHATKLILAEPVTFKVDNEYERINKDQQSIDQLYGCFSK